MELLHEQNKFGLRNTLQATGKFKWNAEKTEHQTINMSKLC